MMTDHKRISSIILYFIHSTFKPGDFTFSIVLSARNGQMPVFKNHVVRDKEYCVFYTPCIVFNQICFG